MYHLRLRTRSYGITGSSVQAAWDFMGEGADGAWTVRLIGDLSEDGAGGEW